ncbi:PHD-finger domain-containing protein [Diaporthe amygdali]|uniref:PHD-finger domain-containing protein n=1 Tax=Phomopsis amygdali TaxID=1214568 RepID=UPI0022FECCD0|nr:PHD-finger domain-containing protein [Diaporthe amygdali]KAJ0123051.1 PHD-finger domain-containing protein [Diaporthe amygdali]
MAGNSPPRRSSRARTVQSQSQSQSQSHHSSTSSSLSGRPERNTRSVNKTDSPQKSTPSLSDEPPDESVASTDDLPTRRRRTRGQGQGQEDERDKPLPHRDTIEMAGDPDELLEEDDGAVRCVCGFDDYPGPPPVDDDKKHGPKDSIDVEPLLPSEINDDVAGLFVQCDVCNVWQHGACVGIMSEDTTPDEYYCEECRKDLHKVHIASNGQRYSHYFPILPNLRKSTTRSRSPKEKDSKERETRSGRQSSITQASKRRSTMNSRDAAYDEEEQLRLAIEASKEVVGADSAIESTSGSRRSKRGRDDSEEKPDIGKRQRTKSKSPSPAEDDNEQPDALEDSEEAANRSGSKKSRNLVTRNQGQHKEKEREERERQRAEAAKKRSGRAERRRADGSTPASTILVKGLEAQVDTDSDPSEELPLATRTAASRTAGEKATATATVASESKAETTSTVEAPPSSQPTPDTPPTHTPVQSSSKPKRPQAKKGKGRNQYTKDRDVRDETSPARSQSRDVQGHDAGHTHHGKPGEASHKPHSRAKGGFNSKVSMTDMKRKASAMLDYISRTQVEMAGETTPPNNDSPKTGEGVAPQSAGNGARSGQRKAPELTSGESNSTAHAMGAQKDFKELSSMEMMARLSTDLVKWQQEFAS